MPKYFYQLTNRGQALREAFCSGYTDIWAWPERYSGELDAFIAARGIGMINLILQHPNPDWRLQAPAYIEKVAGRFQRLF